MFYFPDIGESYFNMLVLLTTANFPDVMLPAYNVNYFNSFFFITYLGIGLYFLFNILLANVYNQFMMRFQKEAEGYAKKRIGIV